MVGPQGYPLISPSPQHMNGEAVKKNRWTGKKGDTDECILLKKLKKRLLCITSKSRYLLIINDFKTNETLCFAFFFVFLTVFVYFFMHSMVVCLTQ